MTDYVSSRNGDGALVFFPVLPDNGTPAPGTTGITPISILGTGTDGGALSPDAPGTNIAPPTGGSGYLGFLSGIYQAIVGSLKFLNAQVTPAAATVSEITSGGEAVTVIAGPINGGFITNPVNAAAQGIATAENLYVDMVGSPGSTDANANGTTTMLLPGQSFPLTALASGVNVKANAATAGHKFTVNVW